MIDLYDCILNTNFVLYVHVVYFIENEWTKYEMSKLSILYFLLLENSM